MLIAVLCCASARCDRRDTFICIKHGWGFGYTMHGVLCAGCYLIVMHPYVHYHATLFLLYELSTPFLHARGVPALYGLLQRPMEHPGLAPGRFLARK